MAGRDQSNTTQPERKKESREVRDLKQQGQSALIWGLPNPTTEAAVVGVALLVRDKLAAKTTPFAAAVATGIAAELLDKTTTKMPAAGSIACTQGCNYCCYSVVSVSAPEVFRVVRSIRANTGATGEAAVLARARSRKSVSPAMMLAKGMACPLLVDGDCSVHQDRPMGCRQYFSASVEACRLHHEGRLADPPFIVAAASVGIIARSVLLGAARSLDLTTDTYELGSALVVALETPDAERRWLAGEDSLAGAIKMPQPPNMLSSVERWSGMLKGLTA